MSLNEEYNNTLVANYEHHNYIIQEQHINKSPPYCYHNVLKEDLKLCLSVLSTINIITTHYVYINCGLKKRLDKRIIKCFMNFLMTSLNLETSKLILRELYTRWQNPELLKYDINTIVIPF